MAMVLLGSLLDHMNLPEGTPCKLVIPEPLILGKKYLNKLIATQKKGSLTLGEFADIHPEWAGEYEWTFSPDGTFNRYDLYAFAADDVGILRYVALDITDWLKEQPNDVIVAVAEAAFAYGRHREATYNQFLMHLGRPHLCIPENPATLPKYYQQRYTAEYLAERADNSLVSLVKSGCVKVVKPEEHYHVQTVLPVGSKKKKQIESLHESLGDFLRIIRDGENWTISFRVRDITEDRRKRLDEMIGLKADVSQHRRRR